MPCRRSRTPCARHERPVPWRGYCSSPSYECSCPRDMSNKCANGHSRRFGRVILALHRLCAVTECRGHAHAVLDRMSGGGAPAQATQLALVLETCAVLSCLPSCSTVERHGSDERCQCGMVHEYRMARDGLLGYTVISSGVLSPVPSHPLCCPRYGQMSTR